MTDVEGTGMVTIIGTVTKKFANSVNVVANNMPEKVFIRMYKGVVTEVVVISEV